MGVQGTAWEQLIADLDTLRRRAMELKEAESEYKQADSALKESENRFYTLFENAPVGIIISRKGRILFMNRAFTWMFGFQNPHELCNKLMVECIAPYCRQEVTEGIIEKRLRGEVAPKMYETVGLKKDESTFPIFIETSDIDLPDGSAELVFVSDITERKQIEEMMKRRCTKLEDNLAQAVKSLSSIAEIRDPCTAGHQVRVANIACEIATELGMSGDQIIIIRTASLVHDIGKTVVPTEILSKPGVLNNLEWSLLRAHVQASYDIVKTIDFSWPIAEVVLQHHERLNGSGYPRGLVGDDILKEARILAVADVIEAMASNRPYRPAFPLEMALDELWQNKGVLYDPDAVEVCLKPFY